MDRQKTGSVRSDREMSISMLEEAIEEKTTEIRAIQDESLERAQTAVSEITKDLSKITTTAGIDGF